MCKKCGQQFDDLFDVTLSKDGRSETYKMCANCAVAVNNMVESQKNASGRAPAAGADYANPAVNTPVNVNYGYNGGVSRAPVKKKSVVPVIVISVVLLAVLAVVLPIVVKQTAVRKGAQTNDYYAEDVYGNSESGDGGSQQESSGEVTQTASSKLSGIIAINNFRDSVTVYCIDPSTGKSSVVSTFNKFYSDSGGKRRYSSVSKTSFPSDYQKYAGEYVSNDGNIYPVWYNPSGDMVNVYTRIFGSPGDFDAKIRCTSFGFDKKGRFYFSVVQNEIAKFYRVPCDNVSLDSTEELMGIDGKGYLNKEAAYINSYMLFDEPDHYFMNSNYKLTNKTITSWLNDTQYYYNESKNYSYSTIWMGDLNGDSMCIFDVDGRNVFDAFVSPDKTKIAFVSYNSGATEAELFISDTMGNNPQKINTDLPLSILYGWHEAESLPHGNHYEESLTYIYDWA